MTAMYNNYHHITDHEVDETQTAQLPHMPLDPGWLLAIAGMVLAVVGAAVFIETFRIFMSGAGSWMGCVRGEGALMAACSDGSLTAAFDWRFGIDGLRAMGAGMAAIFFGPIPLIAMLRRYKGRTASSLIFLAVCVPYGLLAFMVLMVSLIVAMMYTFAVI